MPSVKAALWNQAKQLSNFKALNLNYRTSTIGALQLALGQTTSLDGFFQRASQNIPQEIEAEREEPQLVEFADDRSVYVKTGDRNQVAQDIYTTLKNELKEQTEICTLVATNYLTGESRSYVLNPEVINENRDYNLWLEKLWTDLEYGEVYDFRIHSDHPVLEPDYVAQAYRDGSSNCLLTPILEQIDSKIKNAQSEGTAKKYRTFYNKVFKYKDQFEKQGASHEIIQKLCHDAKITVKIYDIISQQHFKFRPANQKGQFKFQFVNTRLNHVDYVESIAQQYVDSYSQQDFDALVKGLNQKQCTYVYKKFDNKIVEVQFDGQIHQLDYYSTFANQEQTIGDRFKKHALAIQNQQYDSAHDEWHMSFQKEFLKASVQIATRISLKNKTNLPLKHIDQKQAYTNYEIIEEQYRMGFPFITDFRKVDSLDFAIQYNGLYLVTLNNIPKNIEWMLKKNRKYILISAMLKYLKNRGVQIQVFGGMYGKHSEMVKTSDMNYKMPISGKKPYFTKVSKFNCNKDIYEQHFVCHSETFARSLHSEHGKITSADNKKLLKNSDGDVNYTRFIQKQSKQYFNTKQHIYAFILQYQQINLLLQVERMNFSKIHLICVDDIYFEDHKFEKLPYFEYKEECKYNVLFDMCFHEDSDKRKSFLLTMHLNEYLDKPMDCFQFGEKEDYFQYQLHQGPGGFGKTFQRLDDRGAVNQIYISLTNRLVQDQKQGVFKAKGYTKAKFAALLKETTGSKHEAGEIIVNSQSFKQFSENAEKRESQSKHSRLKVYPSNIIIDEVSLVGGNFLKHVVKKQIPWAKVYCLGDHLQLQQKQVEGENEFQDPFDHSQYDLVIGEENFQKDYRAEKCQVLQDLKKKIRAWMNQGLTEKEIYYRIYMLSYVQKMTQQQFADQYSPEQLIISTSNQIKNKWTDFLKDKPPKYRVNKTFYLNDQMYCTGDLLTQLPEGFDIEKEAKNKQPKISLQHCYTAHSVQGMTQKGKLLVLEPQALDLFRGFVYTAVSRLTKIQDLVLLKSEARREEEEDLDY